jgi:hypothetical protein
MGRFSIAAKHHQTIAEIYETELADLERAVQHYEQAADYFKGSRVFIFLNILIKILYSQVRKVIALPTNAF